MYRQTGKYSGQKHHRAKLTDVDVELIRQLHESKMSIREIAKKMDVSHTTVGRIVRYERR